MANIKPTMTDDDVMDFVARGYILLDAVVDSEFNKLCLNTKGGPAKKLVGSPEFLREVLLQPEIGGVIRSLLGPNFLVPNGGHHHLIEQPVVGMDWHSDGISGQGFEINELQCYYYPQDVGPEDGPTMILPGSHCRAVNRDALAHYGNLMGQLPLVVKAGTVAITRYGIWHCVGPKLNYTRRSMIKFSYFRCDKPSRDWVTESDSIPEYRDRPSCPYTSGVESYRDLRRRIHTWNWLCGLTQEESMAYDRWRPAYETETTPLNSITF
tara:strand:- start:72008 stop:72808 length:801 start_codon:yes stop_codon:yes gene_type:complete